MKRTWYVMTCVSFCAALVCGGIFAAVYPRQSFSSMENRELAPPPRLIEGGAPNAEFFTEFTEYYTDTFPLRDRLLLMGRSIKGLFALSIFAGEDDLTVVTGNNGGAKPAPEATNTPQTTREPPAAPSATPEEINAGAETGVVIASERAYELFVYSPTRAIRLAEDIDRLARECGVPAYVLIPPSASELYLPEKYRKKENEQRGFFAYLGDALEYAKLLDLSEEFSAAGDEYIYFRTDHHWTARGAYIAYERLMRETGGEPVPLSELEGGRLDGFLGSMYKQILNDGRSERFEKNPDYVEYFVPKYEVTVKNYKSAAMKNGETRAVLKLSGGLGSNLYNVFFGGDMQLMHMRSSIGNGRGILVVRDSYGHAFLPFLANSYEDVYAVEPRYFDDFPLAQFVREHGIDEVLFVNYSLPASGQYWMNWPAELEKLMTDV